MVSPESIGITIPRNYFDLSQEHTFTAEAGIIYPVYSELLIPGDVIDVKNDVIIRQQPTINPSFSKFTVRFWDFVVAIRNLDKNIYRFMSGFKEYTSEVAWDQPLPKWQPSDISKTRPGTLWDFLENPVNCIPEEKWCQIDYFRQAYGYIWDLYFRNETRQDSILVDGEPGSWTGEDLLRVNWDRDYMTTSLPKQVLGEPMAVPISGTTKAVFNFQYGEVLAYLADPIKPTNVLKTNANSTAVSLNQNATNRGEVLAIAIDSTGNRLTESNTVDFANAASVLLSQLTEMLAIESMHTINAIAGIRDDEFLSAHWGIAPSNEALQYPVPFGKNECIIHTSAIVQTANDGTTREGVGSLYGSGIGLGEGYTGKYHAKEFCVYLKLMYIKPNTTYGGQGVCRSKTQNTMFDFPFIELNHLAMQPIYGAELLCVSSKKPTSTDSGVTITAGSEDETASTYNNRILGYAPNFQWYTEKQDKLSGLFIQEQYYNGAGEIETNDNLYNWTEARFFSIKDGERPIINSDFLTCKIDNRNYQIVDDTVERSQFLVWHKNTVDAWRNISSKRLPSMLGVLKGF